jgi:signal peptidase II
MGSRLSRHAAQFLYLGIAFFVIAADRITKICIREHVELNIGSIAVIPHFFSITHVENTGAAFSMFAEWPQRVRTPLLVGFSVLAILVICFLLWSSVRRFTWTGFALALVLGGAAGNLYDRIRYGRVTDFLHFYVGRYSWPDFNLADSAIVVGATLLALGLLIKEKHATQD